MQQPYILNYFFNVHVQHILVSCDAGGSALQECMWNEQHMKCSFQQIRGKIHITISGNSERRSAITIQATLHHKHELMSVGVFHYIALRSFFYSQTSIHLWIGPVLSWQYSLSQHFIILLSCSKDGAKECKSLSTAPLEAGETMKYIQLLFLLFLPSTARHHRPKHSPHMKCFT